MRFLAFPILLSLVSPAPARDMEVTDERVTDAVEREFLYDHAVSSNALDITTQDGVVTLRGSVTNLMARQRAVRIVETVKGVRSVVDLIEVSPSEPRSDTEVRKDIEASLLADSATESYEVEVQVEDGHATLTGTVDSWHEKQLSEKVAASVRGVTDITNDVLIEYPEARLDSEIQKEIVQALHWNFLVDDGLIDVQVEDGVVTLSGTVGSAAEKRQARFTAWTASVKSVDDSDLDVALWARDKDLRKSKYVARSDAEIRDAVEAACLRDPRVLAFQVDPAVNAGAVTLRGIVDNLEAKRAAEATARNTVGVLSVRNHIKVRPDEEHSDTSITKDIEAALMRDPYVERFETTVHVDDGTAYLYGTVDSYFEKSQADEVAAGVDGVVQVVNGLSVDKHSPYAYDPWVDTSNVYAYDWYDYEPGRFTFTEDWMIQRDIEDELFWSPFVEADDVTVTVEDGIVTLSGTVDSHMEKGAARDNAYEGGAVFVRNRLRVSGESASG